MNEEPDIKLELNLLDNGIDFILKGIDELFDEDHVLREYSTATDIATNRYKYGVIHLFSGFLLLLKEKLARHLPELIFKGKIGDVKKRISSGKVPNTVDLDEALERLEIGPKFVFSDEELDVIRNIQNTRNQFEHYKVSINKYYLWKNIWKFLELIDEFLANQLQINIEVSTENSSLRKKIHTIDSVWKRVEFNLQQEVLGKDEEIWDEEYTNIHDFLMKTVRGDNLFYAASCFAKLKKRDEITTVSEKLLERFDNVIKYIDIYVSKSKELSQLELDFIVDTEIEIIETIAENWQDDPRGYHWLISYLENSYKLQEFCVAAVLQLEKFWSSSPYFIEDLAKVALNNPFDSMNDSYENSCELVDYLDSPRQVALKCLVKHYPKHPKVIAILQDRAAKDKDEQVREWAAKRLKDNQS